MIKRVNVVYEKDEHGYFVYAPELPGSHSQDETYEEASANFKEALDLYLETVPPEEIAEM